MGVLITRQLTDYAVRMSEINTSATSDIAAPLHCSTFNSTSGDTTEKLDNPKTLPENTNTDLKLDMAVNTEDYNKLKAKTCNNNSFKDKSRNNLPKLKIPSITKPGNSLTNQNNINFSNQLFAVDTNAYCSSEESPSSSTANRPVMGQAALLKKVKGTIERNDSLIIHDLITNRYRSKLNHAYNRIYQRRKSRVSSSGDENSDTAFSTPVDYSPASISSIGAHSLSFEERNEFVFPRYSLGDKDLYFSKSTDDVNAYTTADEFGELSINSSTFSTDKSGVSFSPYDPKKFLKNAIGEVANVSCESGIDRDDPEINRKEQEPVEDSSSVDLCDISSVLSKTASFRNSMRRSLFQLPDVQENQIQETQFANNSLVDNLMKELSIQNEKMFQVSKALNYCRTLKGFETSVEFREAEKILLIASCTKAALTKEIQNVDDDTCETINDPRSCGQVHFNNFKFLPRDEYKNNTPRELVEYFVLVLTCGSTVLASDVVAAGKDGVVDIDKNFAFNKLPLDFEISVCIYAMRIRNKSHNTHEHSHCPLPKKILNKNYKIRNETLYIRSSLFLPWGKCEIRGPDLLRAKSSSGTSSSITLKMHNIPLTSSLSGTFSVDVESSVKLFNRISGFLTIGLDNEHGCTIWNRRWCVLEGAIFKYWNYPSEEVTKPLGSLDLYYCSEQQIATADRNSCARPKTLMVPVKQKEAEKKYFLSADNIPEMKQWEKELNYVIRTLSAWNSAAAKIP
ncbi:hypothetical protein NQ315_009419 [Exocentrus adspersus]|uniref:PH domain-containing protein n=1 Tax=Exocentrus adspersus TaxID=1586481 RepID=A0AAV8WGA4_9CUCU|nr:hypothetical protein NQ315_009419 [Exocentrus adspersus]